MEHVAQLEPRLGRTLVVVGVLLALSGVPTLILSDRTDDYFAWTIGPPLTAAFMGAGYWSTVALVVLAARQRIWAYARIAVPSAVVFSALTLAATVLHFDRFHEQRPITWFWVGTYVVVPAFFVVFSARQFLAPGVDPPRAALLPGWARGLLATEAIVFTGIGLALFVSPDGAHGLWAWELTPLTARIVAAWLVGLGIGAAHAVVENDWYRVLPALATSALFALLQLVNLARYSGTPDWDGVPAWGYLLALFSMLAIGIVGVKQAWPALRRAR